MNQNSVRPTPQPTGHHIPAMRWLVLYFVLITLINVAWVTVFRDWKVDPSGEVSTVNSMRANFEQLSADPLGPWLEAPDPGDSTNYESLAWNLSQGRGYGHNWGDPVFRKPYVARFTDTTYRRWHDYYFYFVEQDIHTNDYLTHADGSLAFKPEKFEQTAFAPPGLPVLLAGSYKLFGRQFVVWRVVECVMLAFTLTLAMALGGYVVGRPGAWIVGVLGVIEPALRRSVGAYMTEVPATLLMSVFVVLVLVSALRMGRARLGYLLAAALTLGTLLLFRNIFVLWLPFFFLFAVGMWRWAPVSTQSSTTEKPTIKRHRWSTSFGVGLLVMCVTLAVPMPWFVRNVVVLDEFMPLGTQGGIGLPGGYSDVAWNTARPTGRWIWPGRAFFEPARAPLRTQPDIRPIIYQREEAKYGQKIAVQWILDNPDKLPALAVGRLRVLWISPWTMHSLLLAGFGLVAMIAWKFKVRLPVAPRHHHRVMLILLGVIVVNCLVVMATYAEGNGRFLMPIQPMLMVFGAAGIAWLWQLLRNRKA